MNEEPKGAKDTVTPTAIESAKRRLAETKGAMFQGHGYPDGYHPETSVGARAAERAAEARAAARDAEAAAAGENESAPLHDKLGDIGVEAALQELVKVLPMKEIEAICRYFEFDNVLDTLDVSTRLTNLLVAELSKGNQVIIQDKKGARRALVIKFDDAESE